MLVEVIRKIVGSGRIRSYAPVVVVIERAYVLWWHDSKALVQEPTHSEELNTYIYTHTHAQR
jgi:hypothetical protein